MKWRYYLADSKYILNHFTKISLLNTLKAKIKNRGQGNIYLNRNTSLLLTKTGLLEVEAGTTLFFNQYWHQKDYFPGLLEIHEHAVLQVRGAFAIYSGAWVSVNPKPGWFWVAGILITAFI